MAKVRSPSYPVISLREAVEKIKLVYEKDYQNKLPRPVVAEHMGYRSLNGKSLGVLSAISKFGLLEGRADANWVSDLALQIIAHPPGSAERSAALNEAARRPELFAELDSKFQNGRASDAGIRSYLLTQKFIPSAADLAIRSYRETKQFVEEDSGGYNAASRESEPEEPMQTPLPQGSQSMQTRVMAKPGQRQEVFGLDEGDVTLTFPDNLSPESYEDLESFLQLFLRKAKRRAERREPEPGAGAVDPFAD